MVSLQFAYSDNNVYSWTDGSKSITSGLVTVSVEEKDEKAVAIGSLHLTRENTLNIAFKGIDSELVLKADLTKAKIDEDTRMSYISFSVKDANTSFIFELKPISQDNDSIDVSYIYIWFV